MGFRRLLVGLFVLILLAASGLYAYSRYRFDEIPKIQHTNVTSAASGAPFDVLVEGSDSRAGLTLAQQKAYGSTADVGGARSDAIMIFRIFPSSKKLSLLSIPYDTVVPIAGVHSSSEISVALKYGAGALVNTIERDFHIPINAYVSVNFNGVLQLVQALGGININFPFPSKDHMSGLNQNAGCQLMGGSQALALARSRLFYYYKDGKWQFDSSSEYGRIYRQRTVIKAMISKAESDVLDNALALNAFIGTAVHDVAVNSGLSFSELVHLALDFKSFSSANLDALTLPTEITYAPGPYTALPVPVPSLDNKTISLFLAAGAPLSSNRETSSNSTAVVSSPGPLHPNGGLIKGQDSVQPSFDPTPC